MKIEALEMQRKAARPKKWKKVKTSLNSTFANMEQIRRAQRAAAGLETENEGSETSEMPVVEVDRIVV